MALLEHATGIDVAVLGVGPDEHGLTMRDPVRRAVFIAVARTSNPMRQRSTLAHELAHVLFEDWTSDPDAAELGARSPQEVRADAFARHLLAPVDGLRELLGPRPGSVGTVVLSQVVQRFLVSPPIAAIALRQAGYIDEATKDAWLRVTTPQLATRYGWADQYRALQQESEQRRAPQRLLARAIDGYLAGVVSAQTLATLRGTDVTSIEAELREVGVEPPAPDVAWADPSELPDVTIDLSDLDDSDHDPDDVPDNFTWDSGPDNGGKEGTADGGGVESVRE